jgi:hypothetical protein
MDRMRDAVQEAVILKVDMIDDQRPGERRMDKASVCASCLLAEGDVLTKLEAFCQFGHVLVVQERSYRYTYASTHLSNYHCGPLKVYSLPTSIANISNIEHRMVGILSGFKKPFKVGEIGWVIKSPFRRSLA